MYICIHVAVGMLEWGSNGSTCRFKVTVRPGIEGKDARMTELDESTAVVFCVVQGGLFCIIYMYIPLWYSVW